MNDLKPHILNLSFHFRFSTKRSQSRQKLAKISHILHYSFAQKGSFILRTPAHWTLLKIYSCDTAKNLNCKNCAISIRLRTTFSQHLENKCLYIAVYLRKKKFVLETKEAFIWWELNNLFKGACCLGHAKCFKIFHFNWKFWNFNYFSEFRYFHQ